MGLRDSSTRAQTTPFTLPFLLPSMRSVTAWNSRSAPSAWLDEVRILVAQ